MLYWLTTFSDGGDVFNLFNYITVRAGGAFFTALIFGFIFGRPLINLLRRRQGKGQPIRADGPETHFAKAGTPTMGGVLILGAVDGVHAAVRTAGQPLCLAGAGSHDQLRGHRLRRRLRQGFGGQRQGRAGPRSACCSDS